MVAASGGPVRCAACGYDARQAAIRSFALVVLLDTAGAALLVYAFLSDRRFLWPGIGLMVLAGVFTLGAVKHLLAASGRKFSES